MKKEIYHRRWYRRIRRVDTTKVQLFFFIDKLFLEIF